MKLLHLPHVEDLLFDGQFIQAFDCLNTLAETLTSDYMPTGVSVSEKYDGAPSVVFGIHPVSNLPFVGTKSVFNKRAPKIAYHAADIDLHYGDRPELAEKLKLVAQSIHRFPAGIWQGDLMWWPEVFDECDKLISFTPNTITYHLEVQHPEAREMSLKDIGMCVHTRYVGTDWDDLHAVPVTRQDMIAFSVFRNDCYFIDPTMDLSKYLVIGDEMKQEINEHLDWLDQMDQSNAVRSAMQRMSSHAETLKMFINYCVRLGEQVPEVEMYRTFLRNRSDGFVCSSFDRENEQILLDCILKTHAKLSSLKRILIDVLSAKPRFYTEVDQKWVKGEGFVVNFHGHLIKLVDRLEFSRLNFMNKKFEKA